MFSSEEAYKLAKEYYDGFIDVDEKLSELADWAEIVCDNPNDKEALDKSAEIRKVLHEKYGIKISTQNKAGQKIAKNEAAQGQTLARTLAMSGDDITQENAKTDSTQRSIAPHQNTRLT